MARHKNIDWNLNEGTPNGKGQNEHTIDSIQAALLMDIRDELQTLNQLLRCPNFLEIPKLLREIRRYSGRIPPQKRTKGTKV